jgi:hypothetical protein
MKDIDYSMLPEHCRDGMRDYIERGVLPGNFLCSVICNDLVNAAARADFINQNRLRDYAIFLHASAPHNSWGSPEALRRWHEAGGLKGLSEGRSL